jgi:threonylcarbamoyladenosine tRNA methylthiotransferase CDKAL1
MKFYIETYGCTANFGNSQDAAEALEEKGHVTSSLEEADAVIVNTCAVTEKTERKILRRLSLLQGKRLVVAGCLSAALPESIRQISCRDRLGLLNRSSAEKIEDLFRHSVSASPPTSSKCYPYASNIAPKSRQNLCGIVNIATGCNGGCSYCIVRKARGKLVSRKPIEVIEDMQRLTSSGIAEVQIAAQDTTAYGSEIGTNLAELLERLTDVPGNFILRVGMMNPDTALPIKEDLVRAFRSTKIYRFLHIPVQSGSNKILKNMGRRYSAEDFLEIVRYFRSSYSDITIITDAIVGFPGETEGDFRETIGLIERLQPDKVNITRFSPRPGTLAAELYDMPDRIKKDRSRELTNLWLKIAAQRNKRYEGEVLDALVTERGRNGTMKARAKNYLGIVVPGDLSLGSLIKVKVTASNPNYLSGHVSNMANRDQVYPSSGF